MTPERSVTEVVQDILQHVQEIIRAEVRLAKVEVKNDAVDVARSAAFLAGAAVAALFAAGFALWAAVFALSLAMPLWAATLTVCVLLAVVAGALFGVGRGRVRRLRPLPERTIATVQENLEWMKRPDR